MLPPVPFAQVPLLDNVVEVPLADFVIVSVRAVASEAVKVAPELIVRPGIVTLLSSVMLCPVSIVIEVAEAPGTKVEVTQLVLSGDESQFDAVFQFPVIFDLKLSVADVLSVVA